MERLMQQENHQRIPDSPSILTTTVGSYPIPDWLATFPSEQARMDATRVVFDIQRQAGIDLPTDGELYRFDVNHPDTNGMIDYFVGSLSGITTRLGYADWKTFSGREAMSFRRKPAGKIKDEIGEGCLNLVADCEKAASLSSGPFKFTVTSPYMLAKTLSDSYYQDFEQSVLAIARVLAAQVAELPCACLQVDEANITGSPQDAPLAAKAINLILDSFKGERAAHLCFGNYGGQTIQEGKWKSLLDFLNALHAHHLVLELAHRPVDDLDALRGVDSRIALGIGVVDVKINRIETPDEVARRIGSAEKRLGAGRVRWVHPDCGFWMLNRSVADRKIEALVRGRDRYLGL
jgi:5-methyltetrahydropteroyltriglutamate--homocysteine methyltransferase